ncbi:MAG: hypoxanthine phosphoribosyltransferase [Hyphomicrobiaceae bacterium]
MSVQDDLPTIDVIFSPSDISNRIDTLAGEIAAMNLKRLLVVPILKGSFIFAADLLRALHASGVHPEVDFLTLSSYREGTTSTGMVRVVRDIETEIEGRDVLVIDDILESGRTLAHAKDLIAARGANSVTTCVLLDKPVGRVAQIGADLKAFDCPNVFVVGYGMDLAHRFRELPYVGQVVAEEKA